MYPISDLTAYCRRTTGDVPPKLVGTSTTVVGSKMYLYGGRLVSERKMVSDIYMFDMETYKWERLYQSPDDDIPQARYFHSADAWHNHLVVFGGMAIQPQSDNPEDLCVLNDVRLFDLSTYRWLPATENSPIAPVPKARYAHLSSITSNRLFIIGGQDLNNVWLDDVHVYDLVSGAWVQRRDYPRHCGTYRSVAVTASRRVRLPQEEGRQNTTLGTPGTRFNTDKAAAPTPDVTQSDSLVHLPYSAEPTDEYPCDIFLFSNYNFTDVQRELEVLSPLPGFDFTVSDKSSSMNGPWLPPGLRFPTGAILGTHFIIAGTYLSQTFQSFSIWALDLVSMSWSRVDPGSTLSSTSGSWFRSCLWPEANKFLVFGNKHGNLVEDYNRRLLSWDHVIYIDLEAFGIYQPPPLALDLPQQELGLAALEEGILADFEIICDDGRKIKCSRKLLEDRWPWFKEQRRLFIQAATRAIEATPTNVPPSPLPEVRAASDKDEARPDPRLTPRAFHLSEPYPITLAFLQYLYSMSLITPLQHAPAVLSQLLLLSSTYEMGHLQSLVKHAMHRALTFATSVGIYGVSTLCNCRSLQIRALRVVMAYSQKRPSASTRVKQDRDGSGGGRNADANGAGSGSSGPSAAQRSAARPRGMSDASYMRGPSEVASNNASTGRENAVALRAVALDNNVALLNQSPTGSTSHASHLNDRRSANPPLHVPESSAMPPSQQPQQSMSTFGVRRHAMSSPGPQYQKALDGILAALPPQLPGSNTPQASSFPGEASMPRPTILSVTTEDEILALADILMADPANQPTPSPYEVNSTFSRPAGYTSPSLRSDRRSSGGSRRSGGSSNPVSPGTPLSSLEDLYYDDHADNVYPAHSHSSLLPGQTYFPTSRLRPVSDVPSLTTSDTYSSPTLSTPPLSRTPSFAQLNSTPISPHSSFIPTPIEPPINTGLGVIHESGFSEDAFSVEEAIHSIQNNLSLGIEEVDRRAPTSKEAHLTRPALPTLEIRTSTADTIRPDSLSSSSSAPPRALTDDTPNGSPVHSAKGGAFSRLFKGSKQGDGHPTPVHPANDLKAIKEAEKRRQKQMAKERRERLAREFQAKARGQTLADDQSTTSSEEKRRNKTPWEEESGGVYNSFSFV